MLHQVPGVRVLSEPWSLFDLHFLYKEKRITLAQYKHLLQAALRLQLKPDLDGKVEHMVVKLTPNCIPQCTMMKDLLPMAKFYFQTRNLKATIIVS